MKTAWFEQHIWKYGGWGEDGEVTKHAPITAIHQIQRGVTIVMYKYARRSWIGKSLKWMG